MSTGNALRLDSMREGLSTSVFGRNLIYLPSAGSTNDVARQHAKSGAPEGTVIITDEQTAGRGRLGRAWLAQPGSSLILSLVVRPPLAPEQSFALTMISATSVAAAIEAVTGLSCEVKWPNDVLVGGKKVAGILCEMNLVEDRLGFVIIGIGVNVNTDVTVFGEVAATATSLSAELGRPIDREELLCRVLLEFERRYLPVHKAAGGEVDSESSGPPGGSELDGNSWAVSWAKSVHREWRARLATLGQWVAVQEGQSVEEGLAEDVDLDGALLVRRADGSSLRVVAGDVSLRTVPT